MTALKYEEIDFQFNSKSSNMYLYDEILEENQRKGQALQGMYPMDAQYLFQKIFLYQNFNFDTTLQKTRRISYMMPILKILNRK